MVGNGIDEVLLTTKSRCPLLHGLGPGPGPFAACVGDAIEPVGDYALHWAFEHSRHALDGFQAAALRPPPSPAEVQVLMSDK
jgi:hypothetical protein